MIINEQIFIFGQRLVELRRAKGWSQERLALECGLARSYLGGVERGQRNISLKNIYRLADTLGLSPTVMMEPPKELPLPSKKQSKE